MAKFRQNHHTGKGRAAAGTTLVRVSIFGALLAGLIFIFGYFDGGVTVPDRIDYVGEDYFLPTGGSGEIVEHQGFTLSYAEDWEQAEWVAYILERDQLQREWTKRPRDFRPDPAVSTGSAVDQDYRGSGYDRGHLAPFADFAWNAEWGRETFYLSNISPQARQFNQGIWRELEELTRDWARKFKRLYVVSGPVLTVDAKGYIGRNNRVAIPSAYFKVLLDLDDPERKAIGFVIPNEVSFAPLPDFAMSIDEVEAITELDFFAELMPDRQEAELEATANPDLWPFSKKKFDRRINNWNNVDN